MQSHFFLHVVTLAEKYVWKAFSGRSSLDQRLRQQTRRQRRRVGAFTCAQNFTIPFEKLRKLEENVGSECVTFCNLSGLEVRTWRPNANIMSSITSLSATFFGPYPFQIALANSTFFLGTVSCLQVKHWYINHIGVPIFDQQKWATDYSPLYSDYGWRPVGVGLLSLSPIVSLCCSFAVGFSNFLVGPCNWCECIS